MAWAFLIDSSYQECESPFEPLKLEEPGDQNGKPPVSWASANLLMRWQELENARAMSDKIERDVVLVICWRGAAEDSPHIGTLRVKNTTMSAARAGRGERSGAVHHCCPVSQLDL